MPPATTATGPSPFPASPVPPSLSKSAPGYTECSCKSYAPSRASATTRWTLELSQPLTPTRTLPPNCGRSSTPPPCHSAATAPAETGESRSGFPVQVPPTKDSWPPPGTARPRTGTEPPQRLGPLGPTARTKPGKWRGTPIVGAAQGTVSTGEQGDRHPHCDDFHMAGSEASSQSCWPSGTVRQGMDCSHHPVTPSAELNKNRRLPCRSDTPLSPGDRHVPHTRTRINPGANRSLGPKFHAENHNGAKEQKAKALDPVQRAGLALHRSGSLLALPLKYPLPLLSGPEPPSAPRPR